MAEKERKKERKMAARGDERRHTLDSFHSFEVGASEANCAVVSLAREIRLISRRSVAALDRERLGELHYFTCSIAKTGGTIARRAKVSYQYLL